MKKRRSEAAAGVRRVVLIGFMGAGKSAVGRRLADRLGWRFADLDEAVERRDGRSIPEIFEAEGEARFRELEAGAARELLHGEEVVVATGGGWAARPGRLDSLPAGSLSVWLEVGAREAVRRAAREPGRRPLLAGNDPVEAARELLERRRAHYAAADVRVDTGGRSVDDVTTRILEILEDHESETHG